MSDLPLYPPLDLSNYDLIVVGTGISESTFAAATSSSGHYVLHLDPNPFYGSHFASLSLPDLTSFLHSNNSVSPSPPSESNDFISVDIVNRSLYSSVEISSFDSEILEEQHSRRFNVDLCGPRVVFCADESINLMLKSGANNYVEFKTIDASFIGDSSGELRSVPGSKEAIRKDKSLTLLEKGDLYKVTKIVENHLKGDETISEEDMESPFVDFLRKIDLPPKFKSNILYAIAMLDYDQDNIGHLLKTKEGIDRLALYITSLHRSFRFRFSKTSKDLRALMYPIYGQGELPQAFCRKAAVKGFTYVLRMPITSLLLDKETGGYKGVRLVSGQEIFSQKLILDPCITVGLESLSSLTDEQNETLRVLVPKAIINKEKVARGICVIRGSVKDDISNALIVYPPQSLFPEQLTAIRVLQLGSDLAVCPADMHVVYLSTLCNNDAQGIKAISSAVSNLIRLPVHENCESDSAVENDNSDAKPILLWKALYVQELIKGEFGGGISSMPSPDGNLNYNEIVASAVKIYEQVMVSEELFIQTSRENTTEVNDGGVETENVE